MESLNRRPRLVVRDVGAQPELACVYPRERSPLSTEVPRGLVSSFFASSWQGENVSRHGALFRFTSLGRGVVNHEE
jgi:hypothetical protein